MSSAGDVRARIEHQRLIAIVRIPSSEAAIGAAEALVEGGVGALEFSLAAPGALDAVRKVSERLGPDVTVGAGTVRSVREAADAVEGGASYLVSPNLAPEVAAWAQARDVLHIPGILSPSELAAALDAPASLIKLFPAGHLGPGYVRDLLAPFPEARLVPTGGIDADNAAAFLDAGAAAIAVGSALTADAEHEALVGAAQHYVELAQGGPKE
jgi:2-dehydro-3-deoxyphosphogluconate aldolase/(4S)-4-hydroxy-2-oxoglutarate aldolase